MSSLSCSFDNKQETIRYPLNISETTIDPQEKDLMTIDTIAQSNIIKKDTTNSIKKIFKKERKRKKRNDNNQPTYNSIEMFPIWNYVDIISSEEFLVNMKKELHTQLWEDAREKGFMEFLFQEWMNPQIWIDISNELKKLAMDNPILYLDMFSIYEKKINKLPNYTKDDVFGAAKKIAIQVVHTPWY